MNNKKIIIAGGSGFIGQEMIKYFGRRNHLVVLTRQLPKAFNNRNDFDQLTRDDLLRTRFIQWDGRNMGDWAAELEGADLLINLAGKSVNCRYTKANKKEILDSRLDSVKVLGEATRNCRTPPTLWINASSATIYRHAEDRPQNEVSGDIGHGFSVDVCRQWEKMFYDQAPTGTRMVALRMAITLGSGGVLIPYFNLLKFGMGGKHGSGRQRYSWIHIMDTLRLIDWINDHEDMQGTYNCSSPHPVTNREFMQTLRRSTGTRIALPLYRWMLVVGAVMMGTDKELVLKSRWVIPTRVEETGFTFRYPLLKDAFADILQKVPRKQYRLL